MKKPLIIFDLETTGTNTQHDRIIQICAKKGNETKTILLNPEIPIHPEATSVHGYTNEMLADKPTFRQIAKSLYEWFYGCDLGGFNSNSFDIPMLDEELNRAIGKGIDWNPDLVDVYKLYAKLYPRSLEAIYKRMFNEEVEGAHDAENDVNATERVLNELLLRHDLINSTAQEIDQITQGDRKRLDFDGKLYVDDEGVKWAFGKHINELVVNTKSYAEWVIKSDFSTNTKNILKQIISQTPQ